MKKIAVFRRDFCVMDRKIISKKQAKFLLFKNFEYLDLFPYTIALLLACGEVYMLTSFIKIAYKMLY